MYIIQIGQTWKTLKMRGQTKTCPNLSLLGDLNRQRVKNLHNSCLSHSNIFKVCCIAVAQVSDAKKKWNSQLFTG